MPSDSSSSRDHPRVGGEKLTSLTVKALSPGSPPHGRGKVVIRVISKPGVRITPAWAGKSEQNPSGTGPDGDHPRMGGEKFTGSQEELSELGSPPHGRGKESSISGGCAGIRITPAWAGKRLKRSHRSGIFISGPIPFHSVLHRPAGSGGSRAGRDGSPAGQPQNAGPA